MDSVKAKDSASTMPRVRGKGSALVRRAHLATTEHNAAEEQKAVVVAVEGKEGHNGDSQEGTGTDEGKGTDDGNVGKEMTGGEGSDLGEGNEEGEDNAESEEVKFDVDDELGKLSELPPVLIRADFVTKYGLKDKGYLPNRLTKLECKRFDDKKCVAVFGKAVGIGGRYGYNWSQVKWLRIQKRIKELLQALYQRETPRPLLPHKMARGIVLEEEKFQVNWAAYGETTNKTQRQFHARNLIKLEKMKAKMKDTSKVTVRTAWRKLHVDPRELQSEVCKGRGSSMGGIVLEEGECNSRLEYLGQLLAVENLELEARMDGEQKETAAKEKYAQSLTEHKGMVKLMRVKQKAYDRQLRAAAKGGMVDLKLTQKADAYIIRSPNAFIL